MVAMTIDGLYKGETHFLWEKQMQLAGTLYDKRGQRVEFVVVQENAAMPKDDAHSCVYVLLHSIIYEKNDMQVLALLKHSPDKLWL
ncbi:MAG TPA: hypothetical protein VKV37_08850 [Ktedonobacteraceae bacterium]|jgi:hypothetical protein|nr:hypothetical protein [Ktedonobacteraceae bacterium]